MAKKYGMAIDLSKCIGCAACALACKTENNTEYKEGGFSNGASTYNWADFLTFTNGKFSEGDVSFDVYPTLCNHCTDALCVSVCPTTPKSMYKTADGITMHNDSTCIGCQKCQTGCPYSAPDVDDAGVQYSVISFNKDGSNTQTFYDDTTALIASGTSSPSEVATAAGSTPPDLNDYTHSDYNAVRPPNVVEKCNFCDHRLQNGDEPYCVDSCPANARVFGDLNDSNSEISKLIASNYKRLTNNSGNLANQDETISWKPNIYYIEKFGPKSPSAIEETKAYIKPLRVYPNPVSDIAQIEFELQNSSSVTLLIYDITGRQVMRVMENQFRTKGKHKVEINVSGLRAGTYISRLQTDKEVVTTNIVVTK